MNIEKWMVYWSLYQYIGFCAFLISLYFYIKDKKAFPLLVPFLFINSLVEMFLVYYFSVKIKNSIIVYNYFNIVVILYYFYVYYHFLKQKLWSKYLILITVIWLIYTIMMFLMNDPFAKILTHYVVGLFITVALIFLSLKDILEKEVFINLKTLPIFYFSLGILLFLFSALPILVFSERFLVSEKSGIMNFLIQFANIFLNLGYLFTALWTGLRKKS